MTCWNIQTLRYDRIGCGDMLVIEDGTGRDGDEMRTGRGCIDSWWKLKVRATDRPCSVQKTETEFDRFDIDRSTDEGGLDARANRAEWDIARADSPKKEPIRLFDCALINVVHGRDLTRPPPRRTGPMPFSAT